MTTLTFNKNDDTNLYEASFTTGSNTILIEINRDVPGFLQVYALLDDLNLILIENITSVKDELISLDLPAGITITIKTEIPTTSKIIL